MNNKQLVRMIAAVLMILALTATVTAAQQAQPTKGQAPEAVAMATTSSADHLWESEPNDTPGTADSIYCGSITHGNGTYPELDYFEFYGNAYDHIVVHALTPQGQSSVFESVVKLYDADGTTVLAESDSWWEYTEEPWVFSGSGLDALLHYTLTESGVYYLSLESEWYAEEDPYEVRLDKVTYVSVKGNVTIDGVRYGPADILAYYHCADEWRLFFDASDVRLRDENLADFAILDDEVILMTFKDTVRVPGIGNVDAQDIVSFNVFGYGFDTDGWFCHLFDGSDVGLTKGAESIDSLSVDYDGNLIIGVTREADVPGVTGTVMDEDLLLFQPTSLGENTAGTWSLYFDGSTTLPAARANVQGMWQDAPHAGNGMYMSMQKTTLPFGSSHRIDTGDVGWYWPSANTWLSNPFIGSKMGLGDMAIDGVALGFSPNPAGTTGWCPPPQGSNTVKIMPLGDSITEGTDGSADGTGYRRPLYLSLQAIGYDVDFVGTMEHGDLDDFDKDHEGHSGKTADFIRTNVQNYLSQNPPDFVLLAIGTNDITSQHQSAEQIRDEIEGILNNIQDFDSEIRVILAQITNRRCNYEPYDQIETTKQLNRLLQELADKRGIAIVDLENALTYPDDIYDPNDPGDCVHPNDSGYRKIASAWFEVLSRALATYYPILADDGYEALVGTQLSVDAPGVQGD